MWFMPNLLNSQNVWFLEKLFYYFPWLYFFKFFSLSQVFNNLILLSLGMVFYIFCLGFFDTLGNIWLSLLQIFLVLSSLSGIPIAHMLECSILSLRSLMLFQFIFSPRFILEFLLHVFNFTDFSLLYNLVCC